MIPILEKNIPINKVITSLNLILLYIINFLGLFSFMNILYLFPTINLQTSFVVNVSKVCTSYCLPLNSYLKTGE